MAISPPSDLVMDVVRAAEPSAMAEAQQRLQSARASVQAASLNEKSAGFEVAMNALNDGAATKAGLANRATNSIKASDIPKPYRQYEGIVLQNFISNMLPKDSEAVYGKGNAGEIWKSMMAEQIGNTISERGGVGIAKQMYADELAKLRGHGVQNLTTDPAQKNMAQMRLDEIERKTLGLSESAQNKDDVAAPYSNTTSATV
ncbi:rod-binding protein [Allorhizobium taibaishanense]|uniref:Rod binding domain-containing protein n=1 Tax=Allorhizobium taibaishanense TaxID=887144 RepID=A0A1Q9ABJ5_9HYPH|nr:rod-binding protein [Allorhizobium taibaishanense]MBB4010201.1 Rod binding domain-containing protein [Allorhizobium taibaishanense]OLP52228.1 rod-binding protein [Allorhizobium taibaishanense]